MMLATAQAFSDLSLNGSPLANDTNGINNPSAHHPLGGSSESMNNSPVYSVLKTVLDELDPMELQKYEEGEQHGKQRNQLSRVKDDLINLPQLQDWFMEELTTAEEHTMSMKEIWRHFCFDNEVYCSLALFGNLVYRHVFTHSGYWAAVTRVGETNNKKYNLRWMKNKATSDDQIEEFFSLITEEKEKHERRLQDGGAGKGEITERLYSPRTRTKEKRSIEKKRRK